MSVLLCAVPVWALCQDAMPCCAMLCCAVLCCAVLCCTVLCCAVLCCAAHELCGVQVQAVVSLAQAAGKPLIVDEFNIQRPISQRNEGLELIYSLLQNASSTVAGTVNIMSPDQP